MDEEKKKWANKGAESLIDQWANKGAESLIDLNRSMKVEKQEIVMMNATQLAIFAKWLYRMSINER